MNNTKAIVNKIIPFSSVDGPGNRTAIFLQGCNINCKYCHNPETRAYCINCGLCVSACPVNALKLENGTISYDRDVCVRCDTCIKLCPNDSSPRTTLMTASEVYNEVRKQIPFIRGITVSGGECMLNPDFIRELFILAKKDNLSTLIDSNGTISFREHTELLKVTDGVMLDIKSYDSEAHIRITDVDNDVVIDNAIFLASINKLQEVRAVIAPSLYDGEESIKGIAALLESYNKEHAIPIKIIAYRPMGVRQEYADMSVPTGEYLNHLKDILTNHGFQHIIII